MIEREVVYDGLTSENEYAAGWALGGNRKKDQYCSVRTGAPFSEMEWITFAEKYINEAKLGYANYVKDMRAIHIRILKAASLLVSALQANDADIKSIAGV